jgi:hypothetical protein
MSLGLLAALAFVASTRAAEEPEKEDAQRQEIRRGMQQRAEAVRIATIGGPKKITGELVKSPVFNYSDQPRSIIDATLWVWNVNGRPAALGKIEYYEYRDQPALRDRHWFYCLASLSPDLIEFEASDGHRWAAQAPGMNLAELPDGPAPGDTEATRLRQFKQLARRFSATLLDDWAKPPRRQEMRLLSRQLFRYADEKNGLVDAALFGLTSNGTNPDAILAIELHHGKDGTRQWRYGFAGMTDGRLSARLDDKEVWTKPQAINVESHKNHTYFWERVGPPEIEGDKPTGKRVER